MIAPARHDSHVELPFDVKAAFDELQTLKDDWDSEGAAAPTASTIECARDQVRRAQALGLSVLDVSADVLGGVAVHIGAHDAEKAWIAIMNNGSIGHVCAVGGMVLFHGKGGIEKDVVAKFLGAKQ